MCLPRQITWLLRLGFILTWHARVCEFFFVATNTIYQIESVVIFLHPCPCPNTWSDFPSIVSRLILWAVYFWVIFIHHYYDSPRSESVTLFCFSSGVSVSFEFNSQRTLPALSSAQFIYTCNPACIHKHTHTQLYTSSALPHKNNHTHTHTHTHTRAHTLDVSAGVVPDRNKWQLPNYLLTVDADAAWDALLIFLFLLPPPFPP